MKWGQTLGVWYSGVNLCPVRWRVPWLHGPNKSEFLLLCTPGGRLKIYQVQGVLKKKNRPRASNNSVFKPTLKVGQQYSRREKQ